MGIVRKVQAMKFYMLRLKICGIKNIEKPIEFEFYKKTICNDFEPERFKVQAIYGENGSGKTAVITAVKLMRNLMTDKSYLADSTTQKYLKEIINKKTCECFAECDIYVDAGYNSFTMRYSVQLKVENAGRVQISGEWLDVRNGRYSKNRFSRIFKTENGALTFFADEESFESVKEKL